MRKASPSRQRRRERRAAERATVENYAAEKAAIEKPAAVNTAPLTVAAVMSATEKATAKKSAAVNAALDKPDAENTALVTGAAVKFGKDNGGDEKLSSENENVATSRTALPNSLTLCSFCQHKGVKGIPPVYSDACHCTVEEDRCDCACACDQHEMAHKATCFPGSIFWSVKPPEEIKRLLEKAARWT